MTLLHHYLEYLALAHFLPPARATHQPHFAKLRIAGQQPISDEKKALIDRLLLEKIPLAGIARAVQVSESWLQSYVNQKYENVSRQVQVSAKKKDD